MNESVKGIQVRKISKEFFGKRVLSDINLFFKEGEIHTIVGENGAGKSTLMNILSGVLQPSEGEIFINGEPISIVSPKDAVKYRIGMIHQHFMLIPILSVWQNIILGNEPQKNGHINKREAFKRIEKTQLMYGIQLDINKTVGNLTVGEQQRVEILKVLCQDAQYIIFDEPTAVLTPAEIEQLLSNIRQLKKMGKTILFISHKLEEVMAISDTISVLRGGECKGMLTAGEADIQQIVKMMVGREINLGERVLNSHTGTKMLEIRDICTKQIEFNCRLDHLSLDVSAGEIVGVAGVDGNGQLELVNALLGIEKLVSGSIYLKGEDITGSATSDLRRERIACIPPDRQEQGLILDQSILRNVTLGCEDLSEFKNGIFLSRKKITSAVKEVIEEYQVKYRSIDQDLRGLSGGNQQKVILARECKWKGTELILAVNPTRGLDIGAMEFVYEKLNQYKLSGKAILLISTELSEILTLSDRIAVIFRGHIIDTINNENVDIEQIGAYMAGIKKGKENE